MKYLTVELLMKSGTISNADRSTSSVSMKVIQFDFRDVSFTPYSEHDGQTTIRRSGFEYSLRYKFHVCVCFLREAHPQENIYGEA